MAKIFYVRQSINKLDKVKYINKKYGSEKYRKALFRVKI